MVDAANTPPQAPFAPAEAQTFSIESDRERLSPVALKGFRALAEQWGLTLAEAASLLGVSQRTWERIKGGIGERGSLSQDQLTRISAVVGVYKGLHLLFADGMADRWPRLRNKAPLFDGLTPIDAMIEGGIPRMLEVRRYVDAVRGGL